MSERTKLNFGDLPTRPKRPRPDISVLREVSEEHGFPSRDPASAPGGEGEGDDAAAPAAVEALPAVESEAVASVQPEPQAPAVAAPDVAQEAPAQSLAPVTQGAFSRVQQPLSTPVSAPDPIAFRRRGRPPSDRLYPMNIKVSHEVAQKLYIMRDSMHRATFADVIETLLENYEEHNGPIG